MPEFPAVGYAGEEAPEWGQAEMIGHGAAGVTEPLPQQRPMDLQDGEDTVKVVIRVRPPLERELRGFRPFAPATSVDPSGRSITISENLRAAAANGVENGMVYSTYRFSFDRVYAPDTPQNVIYEESARGAVSNVLQGYNASMIAFGQTGSGKTHTMTGALSGEQRGIIPRAVDDVFAHIQRDTGERCKFLVRASYLQIYNEVISDLLKPAATNLAIREDRKRGVHVEGLSEWVVRSSADVYSLMEKGAAARTTGATKLNELSSRSHAIFILIVEKSSLEEAEGSGAAAAQLAGRYSAAAAAAGGGADAAAGGKQTVRVGKLNLVDLAGSERVHLTGAKGKRLEESKKINQSLSALGNVIAALTDPKGREARPHIPYRDSKLTRILEDSLGGNCKTTFLAMVSPAVEAFAESLSTLKFANRAKSVRNAPRVNEDVDHATLLRKYERELRRLRAELQQRSKDLVDRRLVLQIEEARRREQADKIAAITALERQSAEIARQKSAMATLQNRISSMQSQLLIGGHNVEDTPEFRTLMAAEQARIRDAYASKLAELEVERRSIAEDRAAAERLKALLLKQRDVMVALTTRLGERDKEVLALQAGVEAAEARAKEAEDAVDTKIAELIAMRKSAAVGQAAARSGAGAAAEDEIGANVMESIGEASGWTIRASASGGGSGRKVGEWVAPQGPQEVAQELVDVSSRSSVTSVDEGGSSTKGDDPGGSETCTAAEEAAAAATAAAQPSVARNEEQQQQQQQGDKAYVNAMEKGALREILRKKVMYMVGEVQKSVNDVGGEATAHPKLMRQIEVLRGIVEQTMACLT